MIGKALKASGEMLKGKRLEAYGMFIMYIVVVLIASMVGTPLIITIPCLFPACFGLYYYFMNLKKGTAKVDDLVEFYVDYKTGLKLIAALFWELLIVTIGFILFVIPGIIWSYRYVMVPFILIDNRTMSINDAFKKSREIMHGHKFKYFITICIIMLIPVLLYTVGALGLSYKYVEFAKPQTAVVEEYNMPNETIDVEEVLTNENATLEELVALTEPETNVIEPVANNYHKFDLFTMIVLDAFLLGVLLMFLLAPRCLAAEVGYYQALVGTKKKAVKESKEEEKAEKPAKAEKKPAAAKTPAKKSTKNTK